MIPARLLSAVALLLTMSLVSGRAVTSARAADEDEAPTEAAAPKGTKSKYRRSRLTRDESEARADKRQMLLTTGEDKAVDLDFDMAGSDGVAIGNPTIVTTQSVTIGGKQQIVFKPLKAGETTVSLRDKEGEIRLIFKVRVTGSSLLRIKTELQSLLRDIEGIDTRIVGPKVVVEGEVLVPADYGRLLSVIQDKAYIDFVLNLATLSPLALQVLAKRIQEDVNSFAPNVRTRVVNGLIFLEGTVENKDNADRAAKVATLYVPELRPGSQLERDPTVQRLPPRSLVQNFIVINPPPPKKQERLVRITINFVELKKEYHKLFGFKWQPFYKRDPSGSSLTVGSGGSSGLSLTTTIFNLFPKLQSAQDAGYARILKTGTVITRSGQPASLEENTEFSYTQVAPNGQLTAAKEPVGLSVNVTPLILGQSEDIQMDLNMNQKNLVGRAPTSAVPPITASHKVATKIYVKSNESAAVAGVVSGTVGTDFNKDDPSPNTASEDSEPLFNLLRSKAYRKEKSQFVIFVTPQIIDNASEGTEDLKKNFRVKVK